MPHVLKGRPAIRKAVFLHRTPNTVNGSAAVSRLKAKNTNSLVIPRIVYILSLFHCHAPVVWF
jgi:hypothetical protein